MVPSDGVKPPSTPVYGSRSNVELRGLMAQGEVVETPSSGLESEVIAVIRPLYVTYYAFYYIFPKNGLLHL